LLDYAETDTLTGLYNRKTFEENLSRVLVQAERDAAGNGLPGRRQLSAAAEGAVEDEGERANWLAVIDIDHFKSINDTWGHIYGDEVLLLVAQLMRDSFRFEDRLFRFGGEEFVVILQATQQQYAQRVFDRFRHWVAEHPFPQVGNITLSIGYTRIDAMDTPTEVVGRADEALYFVKSHGRNGTLCYESLLADGLLHRHEPAEMEVELF
jgi:diguanylate cyclase (GGDEF)-like protein